MGGGPPANCKRKHIYYLLKKGDIDRTVARNLYRYHYYLTKREKQINASWDEFCIGMDRLYPQ